MRSRLIVLVLVASSASCGVEDRSRDRRAEASQASPTTTTSSPSPSSTLQPGLPTSVARVRSQILLAAQERDYELLRPVLDPEVFLSDYGIGVDDEPDPTSRWAEKGPRPLELMAIVLQMDFQERDTNEGHLYKWPTYDEETKSLDEVSSRDRDLFLSVFSPEEFRRFAADEEYGYTGPTLGILEDGTWSSFNSVGGP